MHIERSYHDTALPKQTLSFGKIFDIVDFISIDENEIEWWIRLKFRDRLSSRSVNDFDL